MRRKLRFGAAAAVAGGLVAGLTVASQSSVGAVGPVNETTGGVTHTWTNYTNAGGTEGPTIGAYTTVQIACKLTGFRVADGNTWWYRIASAPWNSNFYASADAFYNNGQTSGSLRGTLNRPGSCRGRVHLTATLTISR